MHPIHLASNARFCTDPLDKLSECFGRHGGVPADHVEIKKGNYKISGKTICTSSTAKLLKQRRTKFTYDMSRYQFVVLFARTYFNSQEEANYTGKKMHVNNADINF